MHICESMWHVGEGESIKNKPFYPIIPVYYSLVESLSVDINVKPNDFDDV